MDSFNLFSVLAYKMYKKEEVKKKKLPYYRNAFYKFIFCFTAINIQ